MATQRMNLYTHKEDKRIDKTIYCSIDLNGYASYSLKELKNSTPLRLDVSRSVEDYLLDSLELPYEYGKYSKIYRTNVREYIKFLLSNDLQDRVILSCGKLTKNRLDKILNGDFKMLYGDDAKLSKYINIYCKGKYGDEFLVSISGYAYSSIFNKSSVKIIKSADNYMEFSYMNFGIIRVEGFSQLRDLMKSNDKSWELKLSGNVIDLLCAMSEYITDFNPQELRERYEILKVERKSIKSKEPKSVNFLKVYLIKDKNNKSEVKGDNLNKLVSSNMTLNYTGHNKTISLYEINSCSIKSLEGLTLGVTGIRKLMTKVSECESVDFLTEQDVRVLNCIGGIAINVNFEGRCDLCNTTGAVDCYIPSAKSWGYICASHFLVYNCMLGNGLGQLLLPKEHKYSYLVK